MSDLRLRTISRDDSNLRMAGVALAETMAIWRGRIEFIQRLFRAKPPSFVGVQSAPTWLQRAYQLGPNANDRDIGFEVMVGLDEMFTQGKFLEVDNILVSIQSDKLMLEVLVGMVRFCYRARASLPNWRSLAERTIAETQSRGRSHETTLDELLK
jgi:hypothetical protein